MRPLFILGNNRSGTSLYRIMLNGHSQITIPPESHFFLWWYDTYWNWKPSDGFEDILNDIFTSTKFETWGLDRNDLLVGFLKAPPSDYAELVKRIYLSYAPEKKTIFWGDKNSLWPDRFDDLVRTFPDVVILHIVRNGLDVACSYRQLAERRLDVTYAPKLPVDISSIAALWQKNNIAIARLGKTLRPDQYLPIRFEDLVNHPKKTLEAALEFIGLEFEDQMLLYHEVPLDSFKEPSSFMAWKKKLREAPDPSILGKFKTELTTEEIDGFLSIAEETMLKYGYR